MQNIKMIATDLDRTILQPRLPNDKDSTISHYTAGILNKCRQNGIKIVFATARPKRVTLKFLDQIPADAVILHNGAVIYEGNEQIFHSGIAPDVTKNILNAISHDFPDVTLSVEIDDVFYANFEAELEEARNTWKYTIINELYECLPDKPAEKIIVGLQSVNMLNMLTENPENVVKYFEKYLPDNLYSEMDSGRFIMIMSREAVKAKAVKRLAERYGYDMGEIAAFGDDYNDVEMLKQCGTGVAVANAIDEAKAAADYICDTNENDGVAKWIEENLL